MRGSRGLVAQTRLITGSCQVRSLRLPLVLDDINKAIFQKISKGDSFVIGTRFKSRLLIQFEVVVSTVNTADF